MAFLLLSHCVSLSPSPSLCVCVHVHVQVPVCVNNTIEKDNSPSNVDSLNVIPMKSCLASYSLPDSNPSLSANVLSILFFSQSSPTCKVLFKAYLLSQASHGGQIPAFP